MEHGKKYTLAKIFFIVAVILLAIMITALAVVVVMLETDYESADFVTWSTIIAFLWVLLTPVVIGLSIAGIVLSAIAGKKGEPGAKLIMTLCIITLILACIGFFVYIIIFGVLVGA